MTLSVLIADDEPASRKRLVRLVGERDDMSVVAQCRGGVEAVGAIRELAPQLVLLDVQMPDLDGFGVVNAIGPERMPPLIFVTAHDQYAIRAFEVHATDYLLKPFDAERLHRALDRVIARLRAGDRTPTEPQLRALIAELVGSARGEAASEERRWVTRLTIRDDGRTRFVPVAEVDYLESEDNYVLIHTRAGVHRMRGTLTDLESELDPSQFARIHRRHIVNLDRVAEVQPWFAGDSVLILRSGTKLRLSRTQRESFHQRMTGRA